MEKDAQYWEAEWQAKKAADARKDAMQSMELAARYMEDAKRYIREADEVANVDNAWKYDQVAAERAEQEVRNAMRRMMDAQEAIAKMQASAAYRRAYAAK